MKVFWKDGALNLQPETEEDGQITSAILFAYGEKAERSGVASDLGEVVLAVVSDTRLDKAG
jgi:hypothetical protein